MELDDTVNAPPLWGVIMPKQAPWALILCHQCDLSVSHEFLTAQEESVKS